MLHIKITTEMNFLELVIKVKTCLLELVEITEVTDPLFKKEKTVSTSQLKNMLPKFTSSTKMNNPQIFYKSLFTINIYI